MQLTDQTFQELGLPEPLLQGISDCGFEHLMPVQAASLAATLQGRDLAVQAQTGSGKTLAFLITIFDRLLKTPRPAPSVKGSCPRAIVITPTRELAVQVSRDALEVGRHLPFRTVAVYGGVDYRKQREDVMNGVDVLIGTPGRLIDYLKQRAYHLKDVEIAVIDEADRMFDMGFVADIRFLLKRMSSFDQRQSLLFSATLGQRVMELSYEYMNVPGRVEVASEHVTADEVEQVLYHVGSREKLPLLLGLLKTEAWTKSLIFVNTKRQAERLSHRIERSGVPCAVLSGDVDQVKRLKILKRFMAGELRILVATDVASRGLHIEGVSHVFNYDLPQEAEDYVHRIGRTARAGASGKAVSLACEDYVFSLEAIETYIGQKIPVAWAEPELLSEDVPALAPVRCDRKPRPRRRRSAPRREAHQPLRAAAA
ncbi:MAG: DEAD/DEAH box helicase [Deltaproteobacteria bacterium]|nr:DEAD/DEAH box helicase [Deltaproteobacteria bacterium]